MTAALTKSPSRRGICRYCGMETGTQGNHSNELECVAALSAEVEMARRQLVRHKSRDAGAMLDDRPCGRTSDGG